MHGSYILAVQNVHQLRVISCDALKPSRSVRSGFQYSCTTSPTETRPVMACIFALSTSGGGQPRTSFSSSYVTDVGSARSLPSNVPRLRKSQRSARVSWSLCSTAFLQCSSGMKFGAVPKCRSEAFCGILYRSNREEVDSCSRRHSSVLCEGTVVTEKSGLRLCLNTA